MYRIGIDLGGTKIEGVLLDPDGNEVFRKRILTQQEEGYEAILGRIKDLHAIVTAEIKGGEHTLGIGTPGAISRNTGLLRLSNTVCMNDKPVKKDLDALMGRPLAIQNDANCFAMAEAMMGAGKGKTSVFGVIMGTGCGGGIIFKGQVVEGLHSRGGEWGHMSIDPNGPQCFCGRRGCVETFISGGGLESRYEERYGTRCSMKELDVAYEAGEEMAVEFYQIFFRNFGRAIGNLVTILDPDIIVLGGGVSKIEALYTEGVKEVAKCVLGDEFSTPVVQHQLGDSAGVLGAALIGI